MSGNPLFTELSVEGRQIRIDAQDFVFLKTAAGVSSALRGRQSAPFTLTASQVVSFASYQLVSLHTLTLAFLGDSVTEGCFETWRSPRSHMAVRHGIRTLSIHAQLRPMCRTICAGTAAMRVSASSTQAGGNTSREGLARLEPDVLRYRPDITVVLRPE